MIRILNAEPRGYSETARRILSSIGHLDERIVNRYELLGCLANYDVLIVRLGTHVDREVIDAGLRLKAIVTATTGVDHIDVDYAEQSKIAILSLRDEKEFLRSVPATAEHTWALLLTLLRRVPWAFDDVRRGGWERDCFRGHELLGKRLGILGLGRIGEQVVRYGLAFGMKVGAYNPCREEWVNGVQRFEKIEDILRWSEVLSVHLPLNEKTRGFLNKERLQLLPRGVWLINTSRGAILDEFALVDLLKRGHLAGAALDVLTTELPVDQRDKSLLLQYAKIHENLIITPHLGGATVESMERTEVFIAEKLHRFFRDHKLI